jgi:chromate transporter
VDKKVPVAEEAGRPKLLELFFVFFRISAITIGGGYVMFPLMKREVVDLKGWITDEQMVDYYALGQSVPGIIAMNTAALVGYQKRGVPGAVFGAAGMAAPSLIVILLVAAFFTPYFDHPVVLKAFAGIRSAVVALVVMAVWQVGRKSVDGGAKVLIAVGTFLAIVGLGLHPVLLIVAGGLLGVLLFRREASS